MKYGLLENFWNECESARWPTMCVFTLIWGNQNAVSYTYLLRYIKQLLKRTLSAKIETTDTNLKGVEARLNPLGT